MEWLKFFAVLLFFFSGLVLAFYAGIATVRHFRIRARDRAIQRRLDRVFPG